MAPTLKSRLSLKRVFVMREKHGERLSKEQIEQLAQQWMDIELDEWEDAIVLAGPISLDTIDDRFALLDEMLKEAHEDLLSNDYRQIKREADDLLKIAGLPPLDHDSAEYGQLCRRLLIAKQDCFRIKRDRLENSIQASEVTAKKVG